MNLVGATALVSTALFAVDIISLRLVEHGPKLASIDGMAMLLGLITLVCVTSSMITATLLAITALIKVDRYGKPLDQVIRLSNLLLPSIALAYLMVQELMPSPKLGGAIMALGLGEFTNM